MNDPDNRPPVSTSVNTTPIILPGKHIEGVTFSTDIEWDKQGKPVIYVVGRGDARTPKEALSVIATTVEMINASHFEHVCSVYNMLDLTHLPMMARFINAGTFPSSPKTAHIIVGTRSQTIQLIASLSAVIGSRRLRTMEACWSPEEIDQAVKRWLSMSDRTRAYTINDI